MEVDIDRADKLEDLYNLYKQKGDKAGQLKVLKEMSMMREEILNKTKAQNEQAAPNVVSPVPSPVPQNGQMGSSSPIDFLKNAALDVVAGINRGAVAVADIPADIANAVMQLTGTDLRVPRLGDQPLIRQGTTSGFSQDPTVRQIAGMTGEFLAPGLPIKALAGADDLSQLTKSQQDLIRPFLEQSQTKKKIAQKIAQDPQSTEVVRYMKDGIGRVAKDKNAIGAIKQGFNEGVVAAIKGSSTADRKAMQSMLKTMQKGLKNQRFAAEFRPSDIVGSSMLERIKHVKKVNQQAGRAVDQAAKSLKGKAVNFDQPINSFINDLQEMGVTIRQSSTGKVRANFKGSDIEGVKGAERAIANVIKRMSETKPPDAYDLHRMKKFIDEQVTYGKSAQGLAGKAERVLKGLRSNLDATLDGTFDSYKSANDKYSQTIQALDAFQDSAGTKVDLFGDNADKAIGTVLRRLLSNTQSRVNMIDAITDIEKVAKNTGAKFDDDIINQVLFADELNDVFGPVARTSLAGEAKKAVRQGAEAASGGVFRAAVDVVGEGVEKIRGINQENAIKAMEKLLEQK